MAISTLIDRGPILGPSIMAAYTSNRYGANLVETSVRYTRVCVVVSRFFIMNETGWRGVAFRAGQLISECYVTESALWLRDADRWGLKGAFWGWVNTWA